MYEEPEEPQYEPPIERLTTLGWLKHKKDPKFPYFEIMHLRLLNNFLTEKWALIQGGMKDEALNLWIQVTRVLELDNKARRDLFLLAQSDLVGRTHANKLLWDLLTGPALEKKVP